MRNRAAASALVAALLVTGLSGCNFFAEQRTLQQYDPSDGRGIDVGDIQVRNALLVTEDGTRATLVMSAINSGTETRTLGVQFASAARKAEAGRLTLTLSLAPGETVSLGSDPAVQEVLEGITAPPGELFPLYFTTDGEEGKGLEVPVLEGALAEYAALIPSPSPTPTPKPEPTVEPSPGVTEVTDDTVTE